jgi:hypothetical protein
MTEPGWYYMIAAMNIVFAAINMPGALGGDEGSFMAYTINVIAMAFIFGLGLLCM